MGPRYNDHLSPTKSQVSASEVKYANSSPMALIGSDRLAKFETTPRPTRTFRSLPSQSSEAVFEEFKSAPHKYDAGTRSLDLLTRWL